jgi:hypothetical protein
MEDTMVSDSEKLERTQKSIATHKTDDNQRGTNKEIAISSALGENTIEKSELRGKLYQIRAKCQNIRKSVRNLLDILSKSSKLDDSNATDISEFKVIFDREKNNIDEWLKVLKKQLENVPQIADDYADQIEHIDSCWNRVLLIDLDFSKSGSLIENPLKKYDALLCRIISLCELVTIPDRVNDHLESLRTGQKLDFYETFKDELCTKEDSDKILKYLQEHPLAVEGIVDSSNGVIYKAKTHFHDQLKSYGIYFGLFIIGVFGVFLSPWFATYVPNSPFLPSQRNLLFVVYLFVFIGAVIHVFVDMVKQSKSEKNSDTLITDWFLWGHVNQNAIILTIFMLWFVFAGLIYIKQLDPISALAAGYSFDSVFDVVLMRFDKTITAKTKVIKEAAGA